jgi:hypothetical protein
MKVEQFAIAKSSTGTIGLITSPQKVLHTYTDGNKATVWTGVILRENTFKARNSDEMIVAEKGGVWSSSKPTVIGYLNNENPNDALERILANLD